MDRNGRDDGTGRFAPGWRGGPGRPRYSVTDALRRIVDPDQIAAYIFALATDQSASAKDRAWAVSTILDRLEGRAIARAVTATIQSPISYPATWLTMTPADRDAWLVEFRARVLRDADKRALPAAVMIDAEYQEHE